MQVLYAPRFVCIFDCRTWVSRISTTSSIALMKIKKLSKPTLLRWLFLFCYAALHRVVIFESRLAYNKWPRLRLALRAIASRRQADKPVGSGTATAVAEKPKLVPSAMIGNGSRVPKPLNVASRLEELLSTEIKNTSGRKLSPNCD